jgi:lysophospholipid acyltransferase (LPLAT)-like uncharacterized protein
VSVRESVSGDPAQLTVSLFPFGDRNLWNSDYDQDQAHDYETRPRNSGDAHGRLTLETDAWAPCVKGIVVPNKAKPLQQGAAWAIYLVERSLGATLRCRWTDHSGLRDALVSQPVIFCLWHNRLAISMIVHRRFPRPLAALVSASKDGALLAAALQKFGVEQVRGSTSRRGPQALLELTSRAASGCDLAVTPDGPRGPRYVVQHGVIGLAQVTGLPIIPVTCNTARKLCLRGWDRFQVPLPFSKCEIILREPIMVPRDASEARREELRVQLEKTLLANSRD